MSSSLPARASLRPLLLLLLLLLPIGLRAQQPLRVAVLDFTNGAADAPELGPLGKGLQSMLITDLSYVDGVTLVERERLQEVLTELEFQQSDYVDPSTANKLGEVLGISHLLTGSFVVHGDTMRLDARLVGLNGDILLATEVDGEKDAFFELEKDLAKALAKELATAGGTELAPKVRAKLSTIHTADFTAFRTFSEGLAAFDRADYDAALDRLRSATEQDEEFKLARLTLEDYEELVAKLRARSVQLETSRKERERLQKDKERAELAGVLEQLWAEAESRDPRRRATALYLLAVAYGNLGTNRGKLLKLRQVEDRFGMQRTAEALAMAYRAEAVSAWPALPPLVSDRFYRGVPEPGTFEEDFAEAVEHLFEYGADHPENRRHYFLQDMRYPATTARLLHLDRAEEVALLEEMSQRAGDMLAPDYWVEDMEETLIEQYRAVLRLDESTRLLTARARGETNEHRMKAIADDVERNRQLAEALETTKNPEVVREWLLLSDWSQGPTLRFVEEHLAGRAPTPEGLYHLNRARELDADRYMLVGDLPVWVHQAIWRMRSGPRTDPRRTTSLRYAEAKEDAETPTLILVGASPKQDVTIRMTLRFAPPEDYWPPKVYYRDRPDGLLPGDVPEGRPSVGVLLGLSDVDCRKQRNPHTDKDELTRPMTGVIVDLTPRSRVEFAQIRETERGSFDRKEAFARINEASGPVPKPRRALDELKVKVEVRGRKVHVTTRGHTNTFGADGPIEGFVGLLLDGTGYVEITDLRMD